MRNHGIVFFVVGLLCLFGIWSLPNLNKDEFPQFTIRQAVIAAVYPGATAQEVEQQVAKPLERFLFTYQEINKSLTYSVSEDGIVYVFAELRVEVERKDEVWSKIRGGLDLFRKTQLPQGVVQIVVIDDFGQTSSMLLAIESEMRSPRELEHYALSLSDRLRTIPEMGNIKILGQQQEQISVIIDLDRLAAYNINPATILAQLSLQGIRTIGGENDGHKLHITIPYRTEQEIGEQILITDQQTGSTIRLCDIAQIRREYAAQQKYVRHYERQFSDVQSDIAGANCLIISLEMYPGNNIVAFGDKIESVLNSARMDFPADLKFHRITDQPRVVDRSVRSFLGDLLLSILVVIAVMLMLFPLQTALVASTGVPICTAICLGIMYLTGIELNTVTLAALIVVLGMIVDDSVIVIDGYSNMLEQGYSRWYSASVSTKQLFIPMTIATCAIAGMFFPMTHIITGPLGEFVQLFPWAVTFALTASIFYAVWVIPFLSFSFVKKRTHPTTQSGFVRGQERFFAWLQLAYEKLLQVCFRTPWFTIGFAIMMVGLGITLFTKLNVQMMPKAEREVFAVEIHLTEGSSIEQTEQISQQMAQILSADKRVKSVTSFVGQGSPRFHATYQPQMAKPNYAQFIVNTISTDATAQILKEYAPKYENAFTNAYVRFKQMDYQAVRNPIEIRIAGDNLQEIERVADSVKLLLQSQEGLTWIHSDYEEQIPSVNISLKQDEASELGITQSLLSAYLATATGNQTLTTIWEYDYRMPVVLHNQNIDTMNNAQLADMMIPTAYPGLYVPLRQVAYITPEWRHASIPHRNNIRTITVGADLRDGYSAPAVIKRIDKQIKSLDTSQPEVNITYGGLLAVNEAVIPQLLWSVVAALLVMFAMLLFHFANVKISVLSLSMSILCIFGTCLGLYIFNLDFSITALLGMVSLIGIIVRNAIIMYEYAESLRKQQHLNAREAAFQAGLRRMRPIFLTSATTALGVIPMIVAHTGLWMPMGVVICFGTIFTLPLVVTVLPVVYWKVYEDKNK